MLRAFKYKLRQINQGDITHQHWEVINYELSESSKMI